MRFVRRSVITIAVAATVATAAAPAHAKVRDHWVATNETYAFTFDGCGFEIEVEGVFTDIGVVREGKHEDAGAFPAINHLAWRDRYTNPQTGDWFTISSRDTFVEISATRVEGSIFEFRFVQAGQPWVVHDSEGELVARNTGAVHATYLFDTLGDDTPGGEFVEGSLEVIKVAGPHPSFMQDFCELVTEQIG